MKDYSEPTRWKSKFSAPKGKKKKKSVLNENKRFKELDFITFTI